MDQDEQSLAYLLAENLRGHFVLVVERYQNVLYTFALRLTASRQDAEDIVQEAFVGAYVSLENYSRERILSLKLRSWLYRILLNVYGHYRRNMRLHLIPLTDSEEDVGNEPENLEEERPEALFEAQETRKEVATLLANLPERYRVPIVCYYFAQLSYQEIAEFLGQPTGTVKSTISRGIAMLRKMVVEYTGERREAWNRKKSSFSQN